MFKTVFVLIMFFVCFPVRPGPTDVYFQVIRQRAVDEIESWHVQISFHFNLVDLSEGENSVALLSGPFLEESVSIPVSVRASRGIFSFSAVLNGLSDVLGDWSCVINQGEAAGEQLYFAISGLNQGHMPVYTSFPQLNYQSDYQNVFVPGPSNYVSVSASGYIQQVSVHNGMVYTFPDGGPFSASIDRAGSRHGFPVVNELGETVGIVQSIGLRSRNRIDFHIAPEPGGFSMAIATGQVSKGIICQGLIVGGSYTLKTSEDLITWHTAAEFTSRSNLYIHTPETSSNLVEFYKVTRH